MRAGVRAFGAEFPVGTAAHAHRVPGSRIVIYRVEVSCDGQSVTYGGLHMHGTS
eukprot:m.372532 g.372532  ORF g.372532 m.372532 type:complete len:54 (+) comp20875_c0_seq1:2644-2805(+)